MLTDTVAQLLGFRSDEVGRRSNEVKLGEALPFIRVRQGFWDGTESTLAFEDFSSHQAYSGGFHRVFLTLDGQVVDPLLDCDGSRTKVHALLWSGGKELFARRQELLTRGADAATLSYLREPSLTGVDAIMGGKLVSVYDHFDLLGCGKGSYVADRAAFEQSFAAAISKSKAQWDQAVRDSLSRGEDPNMLGG